jgi:predicted methyltransferase
MNTVDRYTDLQEVLERMREEFAQEGTIEIRYIRMTRTGTDDPFHDPSRKRHSISQTGSEVRYFRKSPV